MAGPQRAEHDLRGHPKGRLRFSTFTGSMTAKVFLDFVKRLLHDEPNPVFLIVDGHPVHRSKAVKTFVDSTQGRLRLFFLPPYSPELNPDEWVWKNVKHDRIGKAVFSDPHIRYARAV